MKLNNRIVPGLLLSAAFLAPSLQAAELNHQAPANERSEAHRMIAAKPDGCAKGECKEDFIKSLSITDEQLEKLGHLKDQFMVSTAGKKAEMRSLFHEERNLLMQPKIDRQQITSVHEKINALRTELSNMRLDYMIDKAEVFTSDQRSQFRHMMLAHEFGHGHGHMHHKSWHRDG